MTRRRQLKSLEKSERLFVPILEQVKRNIFFEKNKLKSPQPNSQKYFK